MGPAVFPLAIKPKTETLLIQTAVKSFPGDRHSRTHLSRPEKGIDFVTKLPLISLDTKRQSFQNLFPRTSTVVALPYIYRAKLKSKCGLGEVLLQLLGEPRDCWGAVSRGAAVLPQL